ncbi:MAG TPA: contractile injection system tape measure protein, partial [Burkholderiaceae bacterium]|nr:contractile injection system tape measure protein [Burkholderiaceae bacterium]
MDSAHVIESLGFELEYASEERMFERQERLAGFARGRGLQVIAEVFDEMSPPGGEVLRLDRLELDLGPVDEEDLEHDLARRLREALRLALSDGLLRAREEAGLLSAAADGQAGPHALMREGAFVPPASLQEPFSPAPVSPPPFGLRLSKPPGSALQPFDKLRMLGPFDKLRSFDKLRMLGPFDKLRANGGGGNGEGEAHAQSAPTRQPPHTASLSPSTTSPTPFGLSLSKPSSPAHQPFDKLRANGGGGDGESPGHRPPQSSLHPRTHAWRAALLHFLQHGHLPWHADRHLAAHPSAALQAVLHEDGAALAAALRTLPPTSPAWRRLAGLAPTPLRLHLARLLAPTAGDWLQDLATALSSPSPAAGAGTQGWRDQAWAALLPALMTPGSTATLPARLRDLLSPVMATVADPAQAPALAAVRAALGEPAPPHPHAQPEAVDPEDDTPPSQRSFWRARVEAALQAGSLDGTADTWRALLRHDRAWLRTRIAALGRSARMRRT